MAIANQEMIRDNNRRQVLEYLVNHPPDRLTYRWRYTVCIFHLLRRCTMTCSCNGSEPALPQTLYC